MPHPSTNAKPTQPLEIIHTDTCYLSVPSIKRYQDFVSFTDQLTRMSFVYYLSDKKPTTIQCLFQEFKERVELHFSSKGYKIKFVRMDDGMEYTTSTLRGSNSYQVTLENYLHEKGIDCEITTRSSPQSNGISECLNRTLLNMACSMLFGSKLPMKLWPQAISAALYLKNRIPHSNIPADTTPYELWFGIKPSLSHLRIFGCVAHVHIPVE